jgi:tetratricopeptide (TPR) repeat protein/predicted Ser/Thr protein kinase
VACIDERTLVALIEGKLSKAAHREASQHVEECPRCYAMAKALAGDAATLAGAPTTEPTLAGQTTQLIRGAHLGRFLILDVLGFGGMGVVYAAYDPELDRKVAIKLVRRERADGRGRLLKEAKIMARLSHANIVPVFDVGSVEDRVYIVMELVEGRTIGAWLRDGRHSWHEVLAIFVAAGQGLAAAHAAGLVHHDFKPDNVLLGDDGKIRVSDFGLARVEAAQENSGSGLRGTPAYMAPEQLDGKPATAASDLFSFCVALWEALYGKRPFAAEVLVDRRAQMEQGPPEQPPGAVPRWLHAVVARGLHVRPELRTPSMTALLAELGRDPAGRRRRALGLVAGVAALVAVGVAARWTGERRENACAAAGRSVERVWNPERAAHVISMFSSTGHRFATEASERTVKSLDAYAADWSRRRGEVCAATDVRREQSTETAAVKVRCLDQRLAELGAFADILAHPDSEMVSSAARGAAALTSLAHCDDPDLAALARPTGEKVAAVEQQLAQVRALKRIGRTADAATGAATLVKDADAVGFVPLQAETRVLYADLLDDAGDFPGSVRRYHEAAALAERGRVRKLAVEAWAGLAWTVGHDQGKATEGFEHADYAAAMLAGLGGDAELEGAIATYRYAMFRDLGRVEEGLEAAKLAVDKRVIAYGAGHASTAAALSNYAIALQEVNRLPEALQQIERAVDVARRAVGEHHHVFIDTRTNHADILRDLGRYDEARKIAVEVRKLAIETAGREDDSMAASENELGLIASGEGKTKEAIQHFERVLQLYDTRAADPARVSRSLLALGDALVTDGQHKRAIELDKRALSLITQTEPYFRARALTFLGEAQLGAGDTVEARVNLERALELSRGDPDASEPARTRFALARALWPAQSAHRRVEQLTTEARPHLSSQQRASLDAWIASRR